MIDVTSRCGIARTGTLQSDQLKLDLPGILYFTSARFPPPSFAEALLASSPIEDPRPTVIDRGSIFLPREGPVDSSIPPDSAMPPDVASRDMQTQDEAVFKVVRGPEDLAGSKAEILVLGGAASLLRDPRGFVELIVQLRTGAGPNRVLYAPGLAFPSNLATLAYGGIDIVDSVAVLFEASRGRWLSADGSWPRDSINRPPCRCSACLSGDGKKALAEHNDVALWEEMELVRNSIRLGELREHVERRAVNNPWNTAVLRHLDLRHYSFQEMHFPVAGRRLRAYSHHSLTRPEVVRFRRRVKERYLKPPSAKVLLLLPCSARKPYSVSKSHRLFREAIMSCGNPSAVHEVIVTSPIGLVPRELEMTYPAAHYDIPVTGDWSLDEVKIVRDDLQSFIEKNKYEKLIAHLDVERPFVEEVLRDVVYTCRGRATDDASMAALAGELRDAVGDMSFVRRHDRMLEDMTAFARFQFGPPGEELTKEVELRGRYPDVRLIRGGTQVAMLTERGLLSLTLDGGKVLSQKDSYCVEIDDFVPQGSVFAVGVDGASEEIRIGDDVVVRHGGDVRAVGVAQMCSQEMIESERGEAVKVRHAAKSKSI